MRINFKHFLSLLFALFVQIAVAQEITVSGVVTDQAGIPIPGANVLVKVQNQAHKQIFLETLQSKLPQMMF